MKHQDPGSLSSRLGWQPLDLVPIGALCLVPGAIWTHLPHPTQASGAPPAVDYQAGVVVFKAGQTKKPMTLDRDKNTDFVQNGRSRIAHSFCQRRENDSRLSLPDYNANCH